MLRKVLKFAIFNRDKIELNVRRNLSYRGVKETVKSFFQTQRELPYCHICQIGDPVLRAHAQTVAPEIITSPAFQRVIKHMTDVMRTYGAMGLSATQIGLSYQIFIVEVTKNHIGACDDEAQRKNGQIDLMPLQVFVNPKMKIIDWTTLKYDEECLSVLGYSAVVPRAKTVSIEALDAMGKPFVWNADGWAARLAQHEMDHLQGKLYIDRMDPSTFICNIWPTVNSRQGYVALQFYPRSWLRRYF